MHGEDRKIRSCVKSNFNSVFLVTSCFPLKQTCALTSIQEYLRFGERNSKPLNRIKILRAEKSMYYLSCCLQGRMGVVECPHCETSRAVKQWIRNGCMEYLERQAEEPAESCNLCLRTCFPVCLRTAWTWHG